MNQTRSQLVSQNSPPANLNATSHYAILPPRPYSHLSLYIAFGLAKKFKYTNFQPVLPYLCSMTTRSRFCSWWGPKLKANLRARSLISVKAGSSFRPCGPCSCSSSVYTCVQETWYIWERERGGNRAKSRTFPSLPRNSKGFGMPSVTFTLSFPLVHFPYPLPLIAERTFTSAP